MLRPKEFKKVGIDYLLTAFNGWHTGQQEEWNRARYIAYNSVVVHMKHRVSIENWHPFPWDVNKGGLSKEDIEVLKNMDNDKRFPNQI